MNLKKKFAIIGLSISLLLGGGAIPGLVTKTVHAEEGYKYTQQQEEALAYINSIRATIGVPPVELDPFLTKAAQNHAVYTAMYKESHSETAGKKGFTGVDILSRFEAAGGTQGNFMLTETIGYRGQGIKDAIDEFMGTAYHREPYMSGVTKYVGIAEYNGVVVVDFTLDSSTDRYSYYPYNGQTGVAPSFDGNENPNPLKSVNLTSSGTVISFEGLGLIDRDTLKTSLVNTKGKVYPVESLSGKFGVWHFFPRQVLNPGETYTFSISYHDILENQDVSKTWSFTTAGKSTSNPSPITNPTTPTQPTTPVSVPSTSGVKVVLNGSYVALNPAGVVKNNATFIPLRGVFEKMGASLLWDSKYQAVTIKSGSTTIVLYVGSKSAFVNGKDILLAQAPFMKNNSVFVPLRFISESIGASVTWDAKKLIAGINTK